LDVLSVVPAAARQRDDVVYVELPSETLPAVGTLATLKRENSRNVRVIVRSGCRSNARAALGPVGGHLLGVFLPRAASMLDNPLVVPVCPAKNDRSVLCRVGTLAEALQFGAAGLLVGVVSKPSGNSGVLAQLAGVLEAVAVVDSAIEVRERLVTAACPASLCGHATS
jgi:hypothetical protein